jgi:predicted transcriptional regulator
VLRTLREQKELTQVQLAKKVRVTQPYIAKLEAGDKANPSRARASGRRAPSACR